jgi:anthranilate phosphoribosyltransferase
MPDALKGGDADYNAAHLRNVFSGRDRGAHRDALVLGAALVLELTGAESSPRAAAERAAAAIDSGAAMNVLERIVAFQEQRDAG